MSENVLLREQLEEWIGRPVIVQFDNGMVLGGGELLRVEEDWLLIADVKPEAPPMLLRLQGARAIIQAAPAEQSAAPPEPQLLVPGGRAPRRRR